MHDRFRRCGGSFAKGEKIRALSRGSNLLITGLVCLKTAPLAHARAIPDAAQRHAPGHEALQTPIDQAGCSVGVNYQLQCAGCHLGNGMVSPAMTFQEWPDSSATY